MTKFRYKTKKFGRRLIIRARKLSGFKEEGEVHQPGYPEVRGQRYEKWLQDFHAQSDAEWYLEVGSETGKSLVSVRANTIAVDPSFQLEYDTIGDKKSVHFFQITSDDFFKSKFVENAGIIIDAAFLDGMHHFEFLLRDFMGAEKISKSTGIIFMHDCIPVNWIQARRDQDSHNSRFWTGDVWKLLPILKEYRKDLLVDVLDLAPTGLVRVQRLDPQNTSLEENYEEILTKYRDLTLEKYGLTKFGSNFPLKNTG